MGLLLYAKGVTDRWQRREGYKCKKRGGWYSYLYSAPYLTLTAGDKGIKCPSESPKQCRKGPLGAPPFATMAILSASHATAHPLAAQPSVTRAWRGPQSDTLVDALERGRRVAACRGKRLAAVVILSGPEACRSPGFEVPWFVFPASSSCRGLVALPERVVHRGKFLGAPWLAFPASSSCRGLVS